MHEDSNIFLESVSDAASVNWGGSWRIPNKDDLNELMGKCSREWVTVNGVEGLKFTSTINGNSIFFPAAGRIEGTDLPSTVRRCNYVTSSLSVGPTAWFFACGSDIDNGDRFSLERAQGRSVRPVKQ